MFRIWFDKQSGMFVIQVLQFYAFWTTVNMELLEGQTKPRRFASFTEADKWVETVGLRNALKETRPTSSWWMHVVYGDGAR